MSVKMIDTEWSSYDSVLDKTLCRGILLCDTLSDLPGIDDITGYRLTQGSKARIIETASKYMMQSDGTWSVQEIANDVYTKSEVDTILGNYTTKDNAYGIDTVGAIDSSGDDLDLYQAPGNYYCPSGTIAGSLQHCPTSLPFRMEVRTLNADNRFVQKIIDGNPSSSVCHVFYRVYTAGGWGSWYQVGLTAV